MSNIVLDDFDKICRMCLKQDPILINIFFSEVSEIIASTTKIEVENSGFLVHFPWIYYRILVERGRPSPRNNLHDLHGQICGVLPV